jgi:phosphoenolpyruvate-protein kinase (PTS system EI component)
MVSGVDEILAVREFVAKETESTGPEGSPVGSPRIGAMIEVPSAVLLIEEIVRESDIICLGTNDLVQYLLAVDRDNEAVSGWFRTLHPAVIRAVKSVITNMPYCRQASRCMRRDGRLAVLPAPPDRHGRDRIQHDVNSILRVRKVVSGLAFQETALLALEASKCRTADEVEICFSVISPRNGPI